MALRGQTRKIQRHGTWVDRLIVGGDGTAPVWPPGHIKPTAAPTGTQAAGDFYVATDGTLRVSNGTSFQSPGGLRVVKTAAATLTAADSGALCLFNLAAGFTYTLPTAQAGLWFDFQVTVTVTSVTDKIITASASEFLLGHFIQSTDGTFVTASQPANGTTIRAWNGNGSTTGGIIGDYIKVVGLSATQWAVWGYGSATGTEASPFATS